MKNFTKEQLNKLQSNAVETVRQIPKTNPMPNDKVNADKATPRPWRLPNDQDGRHHATGILAPWESDETEPYHPLIVQALSRFGIGGAPLEVARANAALIVKAVNEHETLCEIAELCERVKNCINPLLVAYGGDMGDPLRIKVTAVQAEARLALSRLAALRREAE